MASADPNQAPTSKATVFSNELIHLVGLVQNVVIIGVGVTGPA